jgi:hypothetical protein
MGGSLRAVALGVLVLAGAYGCALPSVLMEGGSELMAGNRADFEELQKQFTMYVRWGKIKEASAYVAEDQRAEFRELEHAMSDVRFTGWEILDTQFGEPPGTATVDVRFTAYRLSMPVEQTFQVVERWELDENDRWQVRLELSELRSALHLAQR